MKETEVNALMKKYGGDMEGPAYRVWEPAADSAAGRWLAQKNGGGQAAGQGTAMAAVMSQTPYCQKLLRRLPMGGCFKPVLDDMAQIVGPQVWVVRDDAAAIAKALQKASAVFVCTGTGDDGRAQGYTLTCGRSHYEAVVALTVLEKSAEVYLKAEVIGGAQPLSGFDARLMRLIYTKKYSKAETAAKAAEEGGASAKAAGAPGESGDMQGGAGQGGVTQSPEGAAADGRAGSEDREYGLRRALVEYGNKLVETGLVQGTWGNLSVRLDERYMLCTPSGLDYTRLTPADMVKVEIGSLAYEGDRKPTSEKGLHAAIYQRRPEIGAVIHTHSKACSVFAAARKDLPIEGEAGRAVFGQRVRLAGYALPGTKKLMRNTATALGDDFGCIMSAHGMVCCGADLEDAFAHCELLEQCAADFIAGRLEELLKKENIKHG